MKKQKSDSIQDKIIEISLKSFPIVWGRQKTLLGWDCLRDNLPETSWWPMISCEFLEELLIKDFLRSERVETAWRRRQGEVLMQLGHACTTSTALLAAQEWSTICFWIFDWKAGFFRQSSCSDVLQLCLSQYKSIWKLIHIKPGMCERSQGRTRTLFYFMSLSFTNMFCPFSEKFTISSYLQPLRCPCMSGLW